MRRKPATRAETTRTTTDEVYDEGGAAEFLGTSKKTVQDWRYRGLGPRYLKYGPGKSSVRYLRSDLEAFRAASTVDPGEARPA